jgi:ElaB/YqjD/DUF883 family membrane-anchored ribosome-binding protein
MAAGGSAVDPLKRLVRRAPIRIDFDQFGSMSMAENTLWILNLLESSMTDTSLVKEKLSTDFHAIMADIDALVTATTNKVEGDATALRMRISDRLEGAKRRIVDAEHEAIERAKKVAGATDDYVHTHPWQAVGAAAAVGLAIGVLIARR